jgi:type II secretory pathway component PulF
VLIAITAWLAGVEVAYANLGLAGAASVALGLPVLGMLLLLVRGVSPRRVSVPLAVVLGGIAFVLARAVSDTMAAAGVGSLVALAVSVHVWRLKLRHLMVLLVVVAVLIRLGQTMGLALLVLPALLLPAAVVVGLYLLLVRRPEYERDGLVGVLAMAAREGLPLSPAAFAYGELCSPGFRREIRRLTEALDQGAGLPQAVNAMPGILPHEASVLTMVGAHGSLLAPALREGVAAREAQQRDPVSLRVIVEYPLLVLVGVLVVSYFLLAFVTPRLRMILRDYGFPIPKLSRAVFSWLAPLTAWMPANLDGALFLLGVLICGSLIAGVVVWALNAQGLLPPGPRTWLRRRREGAAILRGLSVGIAAGEPLPETMRKLAQGPLSRWTRRRLLRALQAVDDGGAWPEALRREGLSTRAEAGLLEAAERVGNVAWALREVADSRERRLAYRVKVLTAIVHPLVIVSLGLLVLTIVVAYYLPLVEIVLQLSGLE